MIDFSGEFFKRSNFDPDFIRNHESSEIWQKLDNQFTKWIFRDGNIPPKIPKIIHQIWLGGNLPNKYRRWTESWIAQNPEYSYMFWDDNNVKDIEITSHPFYKLAI